VESSAGEYVITITGPTGETWVWSGYADNYGDALALADLKRGEWHRD
jgi:hypothetical protein